MDRILVFFNITDRHLFWKRVLVCFAAVTGMGFFLSFLIMAGFGTDPCTFMNLSVSSRLGISLGNWHFLLNAVLLVFVLIFARKQIGPGTVFNMVLIGYYADFFCWLWRKIIPGAAFTDMPLRALVYIFGLAGFIISAAVYMNSGTGVSPYDGVAVFFGEHMPIPKFLSRMIFDFTVIAIGMIAGSTPSIGHILMALGLGPVISVVGKKMAREKT
ncbi:MAG: hypothetical protein J6Y89_11260 [Lachnospiraceae bacterium]|nr:hypothetical protein [Lachnospiraceae bacterium]